MGRQRGGTIKKNRLWYFMMTQLDYKKQVFKVNGMN